MSASVSHSTEQALRAAMIRPLAGSAVKSDGQLTVAAARTLLQQSFYTSAILFPTFARGKAGLRICLTAGHTEDEVRSLCAAIDGIAEDVRRACE